MTYSTTEDGVGIRLPTLRCSHSAWAEQFKIHLIARVAIDGIIGCDIQLHFDIMRRQRKPYSFCIPEPAGFDPSRQIAFSKAYGTSLLRKVLDRRRAVVETRTLLKTHTSIFESDLIEWMSTECARQQERMRWGLPTAETRTYVELGSVMFYSTPHPEDGQEMNRHNIEMRREAEFKEFWSKQSRRRLPDFVQ